MKKIFKVVQILMITVIFLGFFSIPAKALTNEEKEIFDMLGVEYSLDENGNIATFLNDMDSPKFEKEDKEKFIEKYGNVTRIGDFNIWAGRSKEDNQIIISVQNDDGSIYCAVNDAFRQIGGPDKNFLSFQYINMLTGEIMDEPTRISIGNSKESEYGYPTYEEYARNEQGEMLIDRKCDGRNFYLYEDGMLKQRTDEADKIIYDENNQPIAKVVHYNEEDILKLGEWYVDYEIADRIQSMIDSNGGHLYDVEEKFGEKVRKYAIPEVGKLLYEKHNADLLEMSLDEYYEVISDYTDDPAACLGISVISEISGKDTWEFWSGREEAAEEEWPTGITPEAITEELCRLINEYRVECGVEPLDCSDSLLQQVADIRAKEIISCMDSAHSRPLTGTCSSFAVGENTAMLGTPIYEKYDTVEEIAYGLFNSWRTSDGHNANMLSSSWIKGAIGVTLVKIENAYYFYASNNFASYDYENEVSDEVRANIECGAQTRDNYDALYDYYEAKNKILKKDYGYDPDSMGEPIDHTQDSPAPVSDTGTGVRITQDEFNARTCFNNYSALPRVSDDFTQSVLAKLEERAISIGLMKTDTYNPSSIGRSIPIPLGTDPDVAAETIAWDMESFVMTGTLTSKVYYVSAVMKADNGYIFVIDLNR